MSDNQEKFVVKKHFLIQTNKPKNPSNGEDVVPITGYIFSLSFGEKTLEK